MQAWDTQAWILLDVYGRYVSHYYDDCRVDFYNLEFNCFVKTFLDELEHPSLITSFTSNMDEDSYK